MVKSDKMFRRTVPARHPLTDILRPKPQLAQTRQDMQADYHRALPALRLFVDRTRSWGDDAMAARNVLLAIYPYDGTAHQATTVDFGNGRALEIHTARNASGDPSMLVNLASIVVTVQ